MRVKYHVSKITEMLTGSKLKVTHTKGSRPLKPQEFCPVFLCIFYNHSPYINNGNKQCLRSHKSSLLGGAEKRQSAGTRCSQSGGNFLAIPKSYPSVHKSVKQFDNSFAFDAPSVWNALQNEIHSSPSLASFRKQLETHLYTKAYPPYPGSSPGVLHGA